MASMQSPVKNVPIPCLPRPAAASFAPEGFQLDLGQLSPQPSTSPPALTPCSVLEDESEFTPATPADGGYDLPDTPTKTHRTRSISANLTLPESNSTPDSDASEAARRSITVSENYAADIVPETSDVKQQSASRFTLSLKVDCSTGVVDALEKKYLWNVDTPIYKLEGWLAQHFVKTVTDDAALTMLTFREEVDFNFSTPSMTRTEDTTQLRKEQIPYPNKQRSDARPSIQSPYKPEKNKGRRLVCDQQQRLDKLLSRTLLTRIEQAQSICPAEISGDPTRRCTKKLTCKMQAQNITKALITAWNDPHPALALRRVQEILPVVCCTGGHHLPRANTILDTLLRTCEEAQSWETGNGPEIRAWLEAIITRAVVPVVGPKTSLSHCEGETKPPTSSIERPLRRSDRLQGKPVAQPAALGARPWNSDYEPYYKQNSEINAMPTQEILRQKLTRPLTKKERSDGFLYVYWKQGTFGLIKIGYTTKTTAKRLQQWQRECGHDAQGCGLGDKSLQLRVRNVRRLEGLVHTELKQYRVRQRRGSCPCGKAHIEWFDVDINHAMAVIRKWTAWLHEEERYQTCEPWALLNSAESVLDKLCEPLPAPESLKPASKDVRVKSRSKASSKTPAGHKRLSAMQSNPFVGLEDVAALFLRADRTVKKGSGGLLPNAES
ncbi:uncharacterized protein HMPREF1541_07156 [Cyphellophora europaea CBS 101466]|uniref:Bacteriophage T5 Orf172 DNA-binding domain-containing protein n=1 Tax=Cyphellophora europaea (strain CBS 101466) TaxID=1220924 RepID=W2RP85_CYPE1|nr:uncharacterized protein HMPREF1541_07156 [Cyphellophora europaea CBS 101466]ETN37534.1 hypothetical protein HMPREF1541_07156 [Cyphellophora europaea CBS 101466]